LRVNGYTDYVEPGGVGEVPVKVTARGVEVK
jgi:hypothetical protein